ncbi:MAG: universal stress protein [Polyangia bacterium]|jgi:nucleotide-binding universal stress UspA family protein
MITIKKILLPVDFSECAEPAIALALEMARKFGASVELLHVWQPPPLIPLPMVVIPSSPESQPINMEELARTTAGAQMKELVDRLRDHGVGEVLSRVAVGSPAHEIVDLAELGHFDLIVMGTHGRSGLMHAVMGSVAEKVVRRAKCPVLTVRPPR